MGIYGAAPAMGNFWGRTPRLSVGWHLVVVLLSLGTVCTGLFRGADFGRIKGSILEVVRGCAVEGLRFCIGNFLGKSDCELGESPIANFSFNR